MIIRKPRMGRTTCPRLGRLALPRRRGQRGPPTSARDDGPHLPGRAGRLCGIGGHVAGLVQPRVLAGAGGADHGDAARSLAGDGCLGPGPRRPGRLGRASARRSGTSGARRRGGGGGPRPAPPRRCRPRPVGVAGPRRRRDRPGPRRAGRGHGDRRVPPRVPGPGRQGRGRDGVDRLVDPGAGRCRGRRHRPGRPVRRAHGDRPGDLVPTRPRPASPWSSPSGRPWVPASGSW